MSVNDINTPSSTPDNEFTQMIEAIRMRNSMGTSLTPAEVASGVPVSGTPLPSVRSADFGRPQAPPPQLTPAEMEELNRAAIASGMVQGPVTPGIAQSLDDGPYGSLEAAIAAGAPIDADPQSIAEGAARFREQPAPVIPRAIGDRQNAREFLGRRPAESPFPNSYEPPHLPDFKKVQMIDMVNGKVYVDGLLFDLNDDEKKMLRRFCITKAKEQVQASLDAALAELAEDTDDGKGSTAV